MYDYYIYGIILLPGLLLSVYASIKVENTFRRYNEIRGGTKFIVPLFILSSIDFVCKRLYIVSVPIMFE